MTTEADLRADFKRIAERGFADCDQEIDLGIASVAAPVSIGNIGAPFSVGPSVRSGVSGGPTRRRLGCN